MATLPAILSCVEDKFKEDLASLHKNLSVALSVVSSKDDVVIDQYVDLLRETSMLLATKFTWAKVNYTLHGVIHHSGDLIAMNGGKGLGSLSEEALEANNKFIRRFLEQFSRKTSPDLQLEDCLARLLERSDPYILERKLNFRPNVLNVKNVLNVVQGSIHQGYMSRQWNLIAMTYLCMKSL